MQRFNSLANTFTYLSSVVSGSEALSITCNDMYICYTDKEGRKKLARSNKEYTLISAHLIDEIYRLAYTHIQCTCIELRP